MPWICGPAAPPGLSNVHVFDVDPSGRQHYSHSERRPSMHPQGMPCPAAMHQMHQMYQARMMQAQQIVEQMQMMGAMARESKRARESREMREFEKEFLSGGKSRDKMKE